MRTMENAITIQFNACQVFDCASKVSGGSDSQSWPGKWHTTVSQYQLPRTPSQIQSMYTIPNTKKKLFQIPKKIPNTKKTSLIQNTPFQIKCQVSGGLSVLSWKVGG